MEVLLVGRDPFQEAAIALLVLLYALIRLTGVGLGFKFAEADRKNYIWLVQLAKILRAESLDLERGLKLLSDTSKQRVLSRWVALAGCGVIFAAAVIRLLMAIF